MNKVCPLRKMNFMKLALLLGWCGMSLWLPIALAQEKLPALALIPNNLSSEQRAKFTQQRDAIEKRLRAFQAAADAFNDKTAENQSDAEYNELQAQRTEYMSAAKAFNQALASAGATAEGRAALPASASLATTAASIEGRLQESDSVKIKREIAGIQNALRQLNKSMNLDVAQREQWMQESERATRDAWVLAGSATLDLIGAHVDYQIHTADSELTHSVDLLSGTTDPNRREQLGIAFKVLKDRKDELKRFRSSIEETQESYRGAVLANQIVEGRDSKVEIALEAIWKGSDTLKIFPPWASAVKTLVDASYLIAVQAASTRQVRALNGNSEQYLTAVKVLKTRMEALVRVQKVAITTEGAISGSRPN